MYNTENILGHARQNCYTVLLPTEEESKNMLAELIIDIPAEKRIRTLVLSQGSPLFLLEEYFENGGVQKRLQTDELMEKVESAPVCFLQVNRDSKLEDLEGLIRNVVADQGTECVILDNCLADLEGFAECARSLDISMIALTTNPNLQK